MSKNKTYLLVALIVLALGGATFYIIKKQAFKHRAQVTSTEGTNCETETKSMNFSSRYMEGVIDEGKEYEVMLNYDKCQPYQPGDLVVYHPGNSPEPIVRWLRAVGGDEFEAVYHRNSHNWNIRINGDWLEYKDGKYSFGSDSKPLILLYQEDHNGKLVDNDILLFAEHSPGYGDSGQYGVLSSKDIIGKIIIPEESK